MIRPISKINTQRDNLFFPKYGEFGFEEPVGRRHLSNKTSAIKKLIFYQPTSETTSPYSLYKRKHDLQRQCESLQASRYHSITPKRQSEPNKNYKANYSNSTQKSNQITSSEQLDQFANYNYRRRDELNEILDPYKGPKQNPQSPNSPIKKIAPNNEGEYHRKQNPNFLNSLF